MVQMVGMPSALGWDHPHRYEKVNIGHLNHQGCMNCGMKATFMMYNREAQRIRCQECWGVHASEFKAKYPQEF